MKMVPLIYVLAPLPKVLHNCTEAWGLSLSPACCYCTLMRSMGPVSKPHHCCCGLMRSVGPVPQLHYCCGLMSTAILVLVAHNRQELLSAVSVVRIGTVSDMSWKLRFSWSRNATDVWFGK